MSLPKILTMVFLLMPAGLWAQDEDAVYATSRTYSHYKIEGNKCICTDSVEIVITDRRGEDFAAFSFRYSKGDKISVNYAYITDMFGNVVRKLKKSEIQERQYSPESFYGDDFVKYFTLKHNRYPYRIHYSVTFTQQRFLWLGYIEPSGRCNIEKGRHTVEVPAGYPIKYTSRNVAEPRRAGNGKTDRYVWEYDYTYRKPEINQSPASGTAPYLEVLPEKFHFGVPGSYNSWESLGEWTWRLNEGLDRLPDTEKLKIDELLEGVGDDREKVRILYHYLQDYNRYVSVSVKLGGFRSYPAEYVCLNRFGDCKALCNYMKAILKYAGIDAYYTLTYSDKKLPLFDENFPNNVFNHIITVVPMQNDTIYLECTSKNFPFGYVGVGNQGRKALLTRQNGSRLVGVPAMSAEDMACLYHYRFDCPSDNSSTVKMEARLRGEEFERFISLARSVNKNDVEQFMRNQMMGGTFVMTDYDIRTSGRDSTFLTLKTEGVNAGSYRIFGTTLSLQPVSLYLPPYESPDKRKTAVQLDFPLNDTITADYYLTGVETGECPPDIFMESPYGQYSVRFSKQGECITVTKTLNMKAGTIPIEEYPEFYDFVSYVRNCESLRIQLYVI